MQNITIGRYTPSGIRPEPVWHVLDTTGDSTGGCEMAPAQVVDVADIYAGWIEGVRDDGTSWIMWLDANGNPEVFWGQRDEGGGVVGDPIMLTGTDLDPLV